MIFEEIYSDVITSFGSLWNFKERGDSLEIITPFASTSHKFVSVFLTRKNTEFIVSDGGWIDEGIYGNEFERGIDCFSKILLHYTDTFKISEVISPSGLSFFYKKTSSSIAVPSIIFDVANFASAIISACDIEFELEKKNREQFRRSANEYLRQIFPEEQLFLNEFLDTSTKQIKPNAIVKKENGMVAILNYITGSTDHHFNNSIGKTNMVFELASKSLQKSLIENKVALVDDTALGYIPNKINTFLNHLVENTHPQKINWTKKEELLNIR